MIRAENRSQQKGSASAQANGWLLARGWIESWLDSPGKAPVIISTEGACSDDSVRRAHRLFLAAMRYRTRVEKALELHWKRRPRSGLRALLLIAGGEIISCPDEAGVCVHCAVDVAKHCLSKKEAGFVNALLRRATGDLLQPLHDIDRTVPELARFFSHPAWLVERWVESFGAPATEALLRWNQNPAPLYIHVEAGCPVPAALTSTDWSQFFEWKGADWNNVWELTRRGRAYIQDPFTRIPCELLAPKPGERVIDLCAAPGGKSVWLARALAGSGELVCVDVQSDRIEQLVQNIARLRSDITTNVHILQTDLAAPGALSEWDASFDAVMLDAPCSNTGVIRRRPDVKERLTPEAIDRIVQTQRVLLARAAALTRVGGRLVYSTCSVENQENAELIAWFQHTDLGAKFELITSRLGFPPDDGHDGGAVFLLNRLR